MKIHKNQPWKTWPLLNCWQLFTAFFQKLFWLFIFCPWSFLMVGFSPMQWLVWGGFKHNLKTEVPRKQSVLDIPEDEHFLPPDTHKTSISGGKKCSFFGKSGILCFLVTSVLRFTLLPYYRQIIRLGDSWQIIMDPQFIGKYICSFEEPLSIVKGPTPCLPPLAWPFFIKLWWQKIIFLEMHNTILQRVK